MEILTTGSADYGRYVKALFCGDPGSGKTLISSTFPNPFFASAEGGLMSIWDRGIKHVKVHSSSDLKEVQILAEQSPDVRKKTVGAPVDTIVVDTIDEVARILVRERLDETKKETMAMGDWGWLGDQLRGIIRGFRNLDLHVVFTCHLKSQEDSETGRNYIKPAIQGAVGDEIAAYVDLALLLHARSIVRVVDGESKKMLVRYLQTTPDLNHPWVKDRSGKLPPEFDVNFEDDFDRIYALIFDEKKLVGEAVDGSVKIVEDLTPTGPTLLTPENRETGVSTEQVDDSPKKRGADVYVETLEEIGASDEVLTAANKARDELVGAEQVADVIPVTREQLAQMTAKDKMRLEVPVECEECGKTVTNQDQKDMSVVKHRMVLCNVCFKAAKK